MVNRLSDKVREEERERAMEAGWMVIRLKGWIKRCCRDGWLGERVGRQTK